jgi:multicomponent Na+:H+ antiporter subunit D
MEEFLGTKIASSLPAIVMFFPFLAAVPAFILTHYQRRMGEIFTVLVIVAAFAAIFSMYPTIASGGVMYGKYLFLSIPYSIYFRVDALGFFMGLLISFLWLLATIHSIGYMEREHAHDRYYSFLLLSLGGCLGTVFAGELVGFFLFFEIMALSSFVLISHEEHPYAMFAGTKYLFMCIGAGLAIFFGIIVTYHLSGGMLTFDGFGLIKENSMLSFLGFLAFLIGMGIKAGVFPLHVWLPDAHPAAPSPVSALLSGVMIKVGAYGMIRVFYQVYGFAFLRETGWDRIPLVLAVITILLGSALALLQDDLKRRLAYSSIAQIGYIVLGISLLSERAFIGAVYHIFTHAFMKGCLFLIAGAIIVRTGERRISRMGGIGLKMPVTMIAFTLCSLSMVGIPPFNGFISKWQLALGSLDTGQPLIVVLLILSSIINAAYYFPIITTAFFGIPKGKGGLGEMAATVAIAAVDTQEGNNLAVPIDREIGLGKSEVSLNMLVPIGILAIGCLAFVLLPQNWPLELAKAAVR